MNDSIDQNPLWQTAGLPRFDRIEPSHVVPAAQALLEFAEQKLTEIESDLEPTWESIFDRLEEIDIRYEQIWNPVGHLLSVKNSEELRQAHEEMLAPMVAFSLRMSQSEPIYQAMKQLRESDAYPSLDPAQQRILDKAILGVELSGIALQGAERERFNEIAQELSKLATDFSNNVLDSIKAFELIVTDPADMEGCPNSLKQLASQAWNKSHEGTPTPSTPADGPWKITLDIPSYLPFMEHCRNAELREQVYRAFISRASQGDLDNTPLIEKILKLRKEKADLLGYDTYADLSLATKMAPSVDEIEEMEKQLLAASKPGGEQDLADITALAQENGHEGDLHHWDVAFWAERLREKKFEYTDDELRPYFPLPRVLNGLYEVIHRLFDVTIKESNNDVPVWNPDVRFYQVFNNTGEQIAGFYLDPYSRPEDKRGGAWMNTCLDRRMTNGRSQLPIAYLVCNGTPPVGDKPSLMTFSEVVTLFHEFGHGLHHMLTKVDFADAAGINGVEWDAVELPSQFMENWCYHRPTLLGMTAHFETGEPLPEDLFEKICKARTYRAGSQMLRQIQFGLVDLELHHRFDPNGEETIFDVENRISQQTAVMPPLPENRFLCAFSHIFAGGYSAGYYSYKWAEVLSADAFSAFEDVGLDNDDKVMETGRKFRDEILAVGGSRDPMESFKAFRGREPSIEPLLRHNDLQG
ncbi:MAG: M3 family metallopeptidase [Planctomycetaceae bacterium]|nr:M3 family metallopeptidase [Planctomycetaceae bacterium]